MVSISLSHLIALLDGPTKSDTGFQGPCGKVLSSVTELPINVKFKELKNGSDLIELPDEVVKDLSADQKYGYEICVVVKSGERARQTNQPRDLKEVLPRTLS